MSTTSPTDLDADLETLCESLSLRRPLDPEIVKRVRVRADQVRKELAERGVTDLAVDLVREIRDE